MKKLLLALALLFAPSVASAQCTGVFPANTICGNLTGSPAPPRAVSFSTSGVVGPATTVVGHFATWNNTTGNLLADFDLFGTANTWPGAQAFQGANTFSATNTFSSTVKFTGLSAGTQTKCLGLDSSNNVVSSTGACAATTPVTSQSGDYTIQTSDCNSIVALTGAYKTITLPAAAGFSSSCVIYIKNNSTTRAQKMVGFPTDLVTFTSCGSGNFCLWPSQTVAVTIISGAWKSFINPGRWRVSGPNFYVNIGSGSDNNDCLATGAGACASIQHAINMACYGVDSQGQVPIVNIADGTGYSPFQLVEDCLGSNQISVVGNTGTPSNVQITDQGVAQVIVYSKDKGILTINGMKLTPTVSGSTGVGCGQNAVLDVNNVIFNSTPGGTIVGAADNCQINLLTGVQLVDNTSGSSAIAFAFASQFGRIQFNTNVTVTGTWNFSSWGCLASTLGVVNLDSHSFTGGTITGTRYLATLNGVIVGGAASCPGNSAGSTTSGGQAS